MPSFTPLQACTGLLSTGRPGGGKTTWLRRTTQDLEKEGVIFTLLCGKPDEASAYKDILPNAFVFEPGTAVFNPIEYELNRPGGSVRNLAMMLEDLGEILNRSSSDKGETFWKDQSSQSLQYSIEGCVATDHATFKDIYNFLISTPASMEQAASEAWRENSFCAHVLRQCLTIDQDRYQYIVDYFMKTLPGSGEKARGAIIAGALGGIAPFTHGAVAEAVQGKSTITPDAMMNRHTILAFDILTHRQNGQALQLLISFCMMEAVLRRTGDFGYYGLIRDEYHLFAYAKRDVPTMSVGRSQKFVSIAAFQSLPVLESALGGTVEAKTEVEALYSLYVNKIMCNNACHKTNEVNAEIIGKEPRMFFGGSNQPMNNEPEWWDVLGVGQRPSFNFSQQWHYRVPPTAFQTLRTGGKENNYLVDAIIHRGNRYEFATISQRSK